MYKHWHTAHLVAKLRPHGHCQEGASTEMLTVFQLSLLQLHTCKVKGKVAKKTGESVQANSQGGQTLSGSSGATEKTQTRNSETSAGPSSVRGTAEEVHAVIRNGAESEKICSLHASSNGFPGPKKAMKKLKKKAGFSRERLSAGFF